MQERKKKKKKERGDFLILRRSRRPPKITDTRKIKTDTPTGRLDPAVGGLHLPARQQ